MRGCHLQPGSRCDTATETSNDSASCMSALIQTINFSECIQLKIPPIIDDTYSLLHRITYCFFFFFLFKASEEIGNLACLSKDRGALFKRVS